MIQSHYHVSDYSQEKVNNAIFHILDDQNILDDIRPNMHVVIKPNLVMGKSPNYPVTTHPAVIRAVAIYLREHGIENITLAESSGGMYTPEHMKGVYKSCQMDSLSDVLSLNMNFEADYVNSPEGFKTKSFHLIQPIAQADVIINICKLKTHSMTGFSGGIKNLFGCIPGLEKPQMHYLYPNITDFSRMLLELSMVVKPTLTIIDAIDAMEGNGPTGGSSHPLHTLFGSRDMYTQDVFACELMKIDPNSIEMLKQAMQMGLVHKEELEIRGDAIPDNLTPFLLPDTTRIDFASHVPSFLQKPFLAVAKKIFRSYPEVDKDRCVGCGKCAESCPAKIIRISDKKAVFTKRGCISCFCCQEMCPMKAIHVKKRL